jgi:hypothetical protein
MSLNYQASALVAVGAAGVKTLIEDMVIAKGKTLVGVWGYAEGVAGLTTLVPCSGIMELESSTIDGLLPCQIPLGISQIITSGGSEKDVKVWPLKCPIKAADKIKGYFTMDIGQTATKAGRFGIVTEG